MHRFSIELATTDRVEEVVALLRAQLLEHEIDTPEPSLREVARNVTSDPRHGFILLAIAAGQSIGIAYAAAHLSAEHGGTVGWLEELYLAPEWRSRGVGSALLGDVLARARQLEWKALELEVVKGHERAVPLYQRHRFQPVSRTRFSRTLG